jgi:hypothetical protein
VLSVLGETLVGDKFLDDAVSDEFKVVDHFKNKL